MRLIILVALCTVVPLTIWIGSGTAAAQDHDQIVQSLLADARAAQSRGDFSQAAGAYQKAVALEPSIPELWANLGLMYRGSGNHSEAIKALQRAARLNRSLFVPQLFLGLEYLQSSKAELALPHLENAVNLNPKDVQAVRALGKVHSNLGQSEKATEEYLDAVRLDPHNGDIWLDLGTSYLLQVENDARLMTSTFSNSPYVKLRAAEVLTEQGKLIDAEAAYKTATALSPPVPCASAEFGITLLREHKTVAAQEQFAHELDTGSHCGMAVLGQAVANVVSGDQQAALNRLALVANADPAFLRSNLARFRGAITTEQARTLIDAARTKADASSSVELPALIEEAFLSDETSPASNTADGKQSAGSEPH